jgi:hypothetical protein
MKGVEHIFLRNHPAAFGDFDNDGRGGSVPFERRLGRLEGVAGKGGEEKQSEKEQGDKGARARHRECLLWEIIAGRGWTRITRKNTETKVGASMCIRETRVQ